MTLDEYERLVEAGAFGDRSPYTLIDGALVLQMTENDRHATADTLLSEELDRVKPPGWHVRHGKPIRIPTRESKPEPDQTIVRGKAQDYAGRSPDPSDIGLLIEVADSSLTDDREQAEAYAAAGIPIYWIVNIKERQIEVYADLYSSAYRSHVNYGPGQSVPVILDGNPVDAIQVDAILIPQAASDRS